MKKVETHSVCFPVEIYEKLHKLSKELNTSDSAVVVAMVSCMLKFDIERMIKNAIQRR